MRKNQISAILPYKPNLHEPALELEIETYRTASSPRCIVTITRIIVVIGRVCVISRVRSVNPAIGVRGIIPAIGNITFAVFPFFALVPAVMIAVVTPPISTALCVRRTYRKSQKERGRYQQNV